MKQVLITGKGNVPLVRITVAEGSAKNTIKLNIEFVPATAHSRRGRHKTKNKSRRPAKSYSKYVARPVIGFMNIGQKIVIGRRVYIHMLNNMDFTHPSPGIWVLQQVTEALDEAYYNALYGEDTDKEILGRREKKFDEIYLDIVEYVDKIAKGSDVIYRSAGMEPMLVYDKSGKSS